jgi:TonB family protein
VFEVVERGQKPFPLERAVLISVAAHVLLLLAFLFSPPRDLTRQPKGGGLLGPLLEVPEKEPPIPIVFREAPGPARERSRPSDFSDADRRAGGGDRSRPKSAVPFVPPRPGIEGLESGERRAAAGPAGAERQGSSAARKGEARGEDSAKPQATIFGPPAQGDSPSPVFSGAPARSGERGRLASLDKVIREAAREAAASGGEGGAGFPNPEGGFVDSGPLSFDTTWYDWGPYAAEMVRKIRLHWDAQIRAHAEDLVMLGQKGKLTIRFYILADGTVEGATILRGSGVPPYDFAAFQAILKSSPFRPLPADLGKPREGITVTFFYNLRWEREKEKERPEGTR